MLQIIKPMRQHYHQQQQQPAEALRERRLLRAFAPLYYACKLLGIYPHDFDAFQGRDTLEPSRTGGLVVAATLILITVGYALMTFLFRNAAPMLSQTGLGNVIGRMLNFSAPFIMAVDQLNAIRKQRHLCKIFRLLRQLDGGLAEQEIVQLHNEAVGVRVRVMLALAVTFELTIYFSTYICYVDTDDWIGYLWIMSCVPTLYNTLDKIWFVGLTLALRRRFEAINQALDGLAVQHEHIGRLKLNPLAKESTPAVQALHQELSQRALGGGPGAAGSVLLLREHLKVTPPQQALGEAIQYASELSDYDAIEERFMRLCQLHCDLCDLVKRINAHWSLPILCLMAYGFVVTIAQFYFFYTAQWDENVPQLFVSARSALITTVFLTYLSGKCVSIMFTSWRCTLEAKRTGICFHRCALAANRHQIYELVNHLSLKLLNHVADFAAGGFFRLDMNNLFGVLGGLTSYLIIFIQFDLEAKQQKAIQLFSNVTRAAAAATTTTTTTALPTFVATLLKQH